MHRAPPSSSVDLRSRCEELAKSSNNFRYEKSEIQILQQGRQEQSERMKSPSISAGPKRPQTLQRSGSSSTDSLLHSKKDDQRCSSVGRCSGERTDQSQVDTEMRESMKRKPTSKTINHPTQPVSHGRIDSASAPRKASTNRPLCALQLENTAVYSIKSDKLGAAAECSDQEVRNCEDSNGPGPEKDAQHRYRALSAEDTLPAAKSQREGPKELADRILALEKLVFWSEGGVPNLLTRIDALEGKVKKLGSLEGRLMKLEQHVTPTDQMPSQSGSGRHTSLQHVGTDPENQKVPPTCHQRHDLSRDKTKAARSVKSCENKIAPTPRSRSSSARPADPVASLRRRVEDNNNVNH